MRWYRPTREPFRRRTAGTGSSVSFGSPFDASIPTFHPPHFIAQRFEQRIFVRGQQHRAIPTCAAGRAPSRSAPSPLHPAPPTPDPAPTPPPAPGSTCRPTSRSAVLTGAFTSPSCGWVGAHGQLQQFGHARTFLADHADDGAGRSRCREIGQRRGSHVSKLDRH